MSGSAINCCGGAAAGDLAGKAGEAGRLLLAEELARAANMRADGRAEYVLAVPDLDKVSSILSLESELARIEGVASVRVNLTKRRMSVVLDSASRSALPVVDALARKELSAIPVDIGDLEQAGRQFESARLLRALAVAGFASANIMLLSVSVWSGAASATRDLFHFLSALIAIPAIAYSGQVYFRSAAAALRNRALNMDVPISLAILLAPGMSIVETFNGGRHAYFDAAVTLLFFLLIGRYLDQLMRERARHAVLGLSRMTVKGAMVVGADGALAYSPADEIEPDTVVRVAAGERFPVDGEIMTGVTDLDRSLVTGESAPVSAAPGMAVEAGTLNLTAPVDLRATRTASGSFLAEVIRMMEAAEQGRGRYVRMADALARVYAPAVHVLAAASFTGWMIWTGGDWHTDITVAIAVLIVTCPCALGLAVPVVHVIGASRLFARGIMMKDGSALERLAEIDRTVFDKTGTLTSGYPRVVGSDIEPGPLADIARTLAAHSAHPASRAVLAFLSPGKVAALEDIREVPGFGMEAMWGGRRVRLGRAGWVREIAGADQPARQGICVAAERIGIAFFTLDETLRPEAHDAIAALRDRGVGVEIVSGDTPQSVEKIAGRLGIAEAGSSHTPASKIERVQALQKAGQNVLMVGDGLNDAPCLSAGNVSMAPASACDAGRMAADFVFTRDSLAAVPQALDIAVRARRLVKQNFALAIGYNALAVPLAVLGFVTPLVAAIAMSSSSIIVIANSLRLMRDRTEPAQDGTASVSPAVVTLAERRRKGEAA